MLRKPPIVLVTFLCLAPLAQAEILPSFSLEYASKHASDVVLVEDGKVLENWKGDIKPGTQLYPAGHRGAALKVRYGFGAVDEERVNVELKRRGLKKVDAVTGKRMVYFRPDEKSDSFESRQLATDPAYHTVWIEQGQAFAIIQWINPGPADLRPLDLTEGELKGAVREISKVHDELQPVLREDNRRKRAELLVAMLKPDARWRNREIDDALRSCGPPAWKVIEPLLTDDNYLPHHASLIYVAYEVGKGQTRDTMLRITAEERAYFKPLIDSGEDWDAEKPPHSYHYQRQSAAQWALDSMK